MAVAVAVDLQDGGVVQETVEDRGGDGGVFEDLAPDGDAAVVVRMIEPCS